MADFGVLRRNELSGTLAGLTRVRRFQQDDAHNYLLQTRPGLLRMFVLFQVPFAVRELLTQLISGSLGKDVLCGARQPEVRFHSK